MPRLLPTPPRAIGHKVLPEHSVAGNGLERETDLILQPSLSRGLFLSAVCRRRRRRGLHGVTFDPLTPLIVGTPPAQQRELGAAALEVAGRLDPGHHAAGAPPSPRAAAPVKVVHVVPALDVFLGAQPLDPEVLPPPLEAQRPPLDAPHRVVARQQRHRRVADARVLVRVAAVRRRGRRGEQRLAVIRTKREQVSKNRQQILTGYTRLETFIIK